MLLITVPNNQWALNEWLGFPVEINIVLSWLLNDMPLLVDCLLLTRISEKSKRLRCQIASCATHNMFARTAGSIKLVNLEPSPLQKCKYLGHYQQVINWFAEVTAEHKHWLGAPERFSLSKQHNVTDLSLALFNQHVLLNISEHHKISIQ